MTKKVSCWLLGLMVGLSAVSSSAAVSEVALQELYKTAKAEGQVIWTWGGTEREILPLLACSVSPSANVPQDLFIPKGAAHPNAAKLLVSWLSSNEGRKTFTKLTGSGLAFPSDASPLAQLLANAGVTFHRVGSIEEVEDYLRFTEIMVKTMGFLPQ